MDQPPLSPAAAISRKLAHHSWALAVVVPATGLRGHIQRRGELFLKFESFQGWLLFAGVVAAASRRDQPFLHELLSLPISEMPTAEFDGPNLEEMM